VTTVLPLAVDDRLVGSTLLLGIFEKRLFFATALHLVAGSRIQIAIPPHGGNCQEPQVYPINGTPAMDATISATDPFTDLAILSASADANIPTTPKLAPSAGLIPVGTEVVVLGYPFAPLGSFLETWTPAHVTALARRQIAPGLEVDEIILSAVSHPGASGSAIVGRHDGIIYGLLRGALAPPEVIKIGEIPIATDTSVTYATSAHYIVELLAYARTVRDSEV